MSFLNSLLQNLCLRQLDDASKFRRRQLSAHSEACRAQATAFLACCCQHRMNGKIRHFALKLQLPLAAHAAFSQKYTLFPSKGAEMVDFQTLLIYDTIKGHPLNL